METQDLFAHKSKTWDMSSMRTQNAQSIAHKILENINILKDMNLLDLGAGTGLLSYFVAPHVASITAVDNSPSMLEEFRQKCSEFECETRILECDFAHDEIDEQFDGIISSMTIHHIEDIERLFLKLSSTLKTGGFIALADLDSEDGSFHGDNTGVFHYGFERGVLEGAAKKAGFEEITFLTASTISKPHRDFTIFLMCARRK